MYAVLDYGQKAHLQAAERLWERRLPALQAKERTSGGMQWKAAKGKDYLIRHWNDRATKKKASTSLGVRSPETERIYAEFNRTREHADAELAKHSEHLDRFARVSKAIRLPRLGPVQTDVFRALGVNDMDRALMTFSADALMAYGARFGVEFSGQGAFQPSLTLYFASPDMDIDQDGLLSVLMNSTRGMEYDGEGFFVDRAAGRFTVVPYSQRGLFRSLRQVADFDEDQQDALSEVLDDDAVWSVIIGDDGAPVPVSAVPPKAFVFLALMTRAIEPELVLSMARVACSHMDLSFSYREIEAFPELEGVVEDAGSPRLRF